MTAPEPTFPLQEHRVRAWRELPFVRRLSDDGAVDDDIEDLSVRFGDLDAPRSRERLECPFDGDRGFRQLPADLEWP